MSETMHIMGDWETKEVCINGLTLYPDKSQKVWNHSPDGFNWSYHGSGPAQLALAILLIVAPKSVAIELHQSFKREFIATLPASDFNIEIDVRDWIGKKLNSN